MVSGSQSRTVQHPGMTHSATRYCKTEENPSQFWRRIPSALHIAKTLFGALFLHALALPRRESACALAASVADRIGHALSLGGVCCVAFKNRFLRIWQRFAEKREATKPSITIRAAFATLL